MSFPFSEKRMVRRYGSQKGSEKEGQENRYRNMLAHFEQLIHEAEERE
jgi:hypothetical protein